MSDLISRQAAIDALAEQMSTPYTPDGSHPADEQIFQVQEVYVDCITTIKLLPTIQPETRTGKWTLGFDNKYMEKYYYCSCCGGRKYGEHEPLDYFCSNCGARMKGERQK